MTSLSKLILVFICLPQHHSRPLVTSISGPTIAICDMNPLGNCSGSSVNIFCPPTTHGTRILPNTSLFHRSGVSLSPLMTIATLPKASPTVIGSASTPWPLSNTEFWTGWRAPVPRASTSCEVVIVSGFFRVEPGSEVQALDWLSFKTFLALQLYLYYSIVRPNKKAHVLELKRPSRVYGRHRENVDNSSFKPLPHRDASPRSPNKPKLVWLIEDCFKIKFLLMCQD